MKKLLFLLLIATTSLTAYCQDSIKVPSPADTAKLTAAKVYNDVKAGITGLAGALKVGAEHVYGILVKQQVVNSITWLLLLIMTFAFAINVIKAFKNAGEKWWDGNNDMPTWVGVIRVIQLAGSMVGFIIGVFHIDAIVMGFVNPEYGAIKDIINFVK